MSVNKAFKPTMAWWRVAWCWVLKLGHSVGACSAMPKHCHGDTTVCACGSFVVLLPLYHNAMRYLDNLQNYSCFNTQHLLLGKVIFIAENSLNSIPDLCTTTFLHCISVQCFQRTSATSYHIS